MIQSCLLSREELMKMILNSQKTKDGYYFFPRFKILSRIKGKKKDNEYYYDRELFFNKMCFNDEEIKLFMSKRKMKYDIELMKIIDNRLNDILAGIEYLDLVDKIPDKDFNLEELIDSCIYMIKYKYG